MLLLFSMMYTILVRFAEGAEMNLCVFHAFQEVSVMIQFYAICNGQSRLTPFPQLPPQPLLTGQQID